MNIYCVLFNAKRPSVVPTNSYMGNNLLGIIRQDALALRDQGFQIYWRRDGKGFDALFEDGRRYYSTWVA